jgi:hypothetical protein
MFEFAAPHPGIQTISLLPNPQFSDTEALTASVSTQRATDGTLYTYVKTKGGRRKLSWTFRLLRPKALELRAFLLSYFASKVRVTDHNNRVWVGNFTNNPFEFTADSGGPMLGDLRGELQSITIEFEGVEQ